MDIPTARHGGSDDGADVPHHGTASDASEQDPIASMHDTAEEAGDETGLADTYSMDLRSADQLGVALDRSEEVRPDLAQGT